MEKSCSKILYLLFVIGYSIKETVPTTLPIPDVEQCQHIINSKSPLTTLADIVGVGFDALRNTPMEAVHATTFNECKTTSDFSYLIPDGLRASLVKQSDLDRLATFYETYRQYFESTKDTIQVDGDAGFIGSSISGSFSRTHIEIKEKSLAHNTSIFRTRLRYHYGTLIGRTNAVFETNLKNRLIDIGKAIEANDTEIAEYLSRLIVRDYGTHVVTRAEVGAEISQDDYVDSKSIKDKQSTFDDMKASASASFFASCNIKTSVGRTVNKTTQDQFYSLIRHTSVNTKGGPNVNRLLAANGSDRPSTPLAVDDIVALDRSGEPLYYVVTPRNLIELSSDLVWKIALQLKNATDEYYVRNTHYGCVDSSADNFDINANIDDGTCKQQASDYGFGGYYQRDIQQCDSCHFERDLSQRNGLTGDYSCPKSYTAVKLISHPFSFPFPFFASEKLDVYWCKPDNDNVSLSSGYMFGGFYSKSQINPFTGSYGCPGRFLAFPFLIDSTICLSREYESESQFSIRLGNFFSCQTLASEARCAPGYSQRLVSILGSCEIYYCVRPERKDKPKILDVNRPPYGEFVFRDQRENSTSRNGTLD